MSRRLSDPPWNDPHNAMKWFVWRLGKAHPAHQTDQPTQRSVIDPTTRLNRPMKPPLFGARRHLAVTRYALTPPHWTPGLRLKVVLLADVHACNPWMSAKRIAYIVEQANALEPDLVLLLGDFTPAMPLFITSHVPSSVWAPILASLKAPLGRFAVMGNHDWWEDRNAQRQGEGPTFGHRALAEAGVPVLENTALRLVHHGHAFWLAGLGDQRALLPRRRYGRREGRGMDDLPATLDVVTDEAPILLMAHEPDIFPQVRGADSPVSLTLSGHTHGGQVRIRGYSPVVPSRYGNRYAYGHVIEPKPAGGEAHLVVSGGLGCSIAPIRIGVPPEIVLLDLGAQ